MTALAIVLVLSALAAVYVVYVQPVRAERRRRREEVAAINSGRRRCTVCGVTDGWPKHLTVTALGAVTAHHFLCGTGRGCLLCARRPRRVEHRV